MFISFFVYHIGVYFAIGAMSQDTEKAARSGLFLFFKSIHCSREESHPIQGDRPQ